MSVAFARDFLVGTPTAVESRPSIGWHNLMVLGTLSADSEDGEHVAELAVDGITATGWRTAVGSGTSHWIEVLLSQAEQADYAAIAAHTLGNTTVVPQYHDGLDWLDAGDPVALASNAPAGWLFDAQSSDRWRLEITGAPEVIELGALHIGQALRPDTGLRGGWRPPSLNEDIEYTSPISVGGQLLQRQVRRRGVDVRLDLPRLGFDFARDEWLTFIDAASARAFFFWLLFAGHAEIVYGGLENHGGAITRARNTDLDLVMRGIAR